jgi:hypothetical protein
MPMERSGQKSWAAITVLAEARNWWKVALAMAWSLPWMRPAVT